MTKASSETSVDGKMVGDRLERKGDVGEMMLATLFYLGQAMLKT